MSTDTFVNALRNHRPSGVDSLGRLTELLDEELAMGVFGKEELEAMMHRLYHNRDFQTLLTALRRTISVCNGRLVGESLRFSPEERCPELAPAPRPRKTTPAGARCRTMRRSVVCRALRERGIE